MSRPKKLPPGIDAKGRKYRARMSYMGRQYTLGTYYTVRDAEAALATARGQAAVHTFIDPAERKRLVKAQREAEKAAAITVRQWSDVWLEALEKGGRTTSTMRTYRSALDAHVLPELGDLPLASVTPTDVEAMLDAVPGSRTTRNNVAGVTRAMFLAAVKAKAGGITESPVQVEIRKAQRRQISPNDDALPTVEQVDALAAAMPPRLAAAVPLAAWCALREGEVLGLQRRDFRGWDTGRLTISVERQWASKAKPPQYTPPKDGSVRRVNVPDSLVAPLRAHLELYVHEAPDAPVFHGADVRRPMSQTAFTKAWNKARAEVFPGLHFHDLRHVGLSRFMQSGGSLVETMRRGGHKNVEAALRYQHAEDSRDRSVTEALDGYLREGS